MAAVVFIVQLLKCKMYSEIMLQGKQRQGFITKYCENTVLVKEIKMVIYH